MKNKYSHLLITLVIFCLLSIAVVSAAAIVSSGESGNDLSAVSELSDSTVSVQTELSEQAPTDFETLLQLRASLAGQNPVLTLETAMQIAEKVQAFYETDVTFSLPGLTDLAGKAADFAETVSLQKPLNYEALAGTSGVFFTGSALAEEATLCARQTEQINQMILYTLFALTPAEYTFPAAELMSEEERGMSNSQSYLEITYLVLAGDYDTPEEAAALLQADSGEIGYIKCFGNNAVYHCGETEVRLTLDYWEREEFLAFWEEY